MDKIINDFSWKIAGAAGDGILNAGLLMFAKTCVRGGLNVFAYSEYPSLIRGGHNHLDVRVSDKPLYAQTRFFSLIVALNQESVDKHMDKLVQEGGIIYDGNIVNAKNIRDDIRKYSIPLQEIADECGGHIMRNTVAIGATFALINFDLSLLNSIIKQNFEKKGEKIVENNIKAAKAGYDHIKQHFKDDFKFGLKTTEEKENIFLSGHEAVSMGAIKAGCKFYAAYPMTPATTVLHTMAAMEKKYNIVVKHTEDEIAAINMAVGASFAGVRAMTGTSGGGFALMTEGFGLAAQTETPIVVVESQRPGPGTGMATHSGQGDLKYVLHASTDEFPRIIIAPGDIEECFYLSFQAFNLAEKYQLPVIILTDKYLGESYSSAKQFETTNMKIDRGRMITNEELSKINEFKRYKITDNGISPRSIPSQPNGIYVASSYEHDEHGFEREEEEIRIAMHDKRYRKIETAKKEIPEPELYGPKDAEITLIGWGSTKGPIKQAIEMLKKKGMKINFLHIVFISPFHEKKISHILKKAKKTIIVENNKTAQLAGLIKEKTGIEIDHKILKYDGRPFFPEDIFIEINKLAKV